MKQKKVFNIPTKKKDHPPLRCIACVYVCMYVCVCTQACQRSQSLASMLTHISTVSHYASKHFEPCLEAPAPLLLPSELSLPDVKITLSSPHKSLSQTTWSLEVPPPPHHTLPAHTLLVYLSVLSPFRTLTSHFNGALCIHH